MNSLRLSLHKKQLEVFNSRKKYQLWVAGRRTGKSRCLAVKAIHKALITKIDKKSLSPPVILIAGPTVSQVKQIHFLPMAEMLKGEPFVEDINKSDLRIILKGDHPDIIFRSGEAAERARGSRLAAFLGDEMADMPRTFWEDIILPALSDTPNSTALLISSPKGKANWLYDLYQQALENPESWDYFHATTADNPFFPKEEFERLRINMSESSFRREMLADWVDFEGQIFDQLQDKHILEVSTNPDDYDATYLALDWGSRNAACLVVGQRGSPPVYTVLDSWAPITEESMPFAVHKQKALELATKYKVVSTWPDLFTPLHQEFVFQLQQLGHTGLANINLEAKKFETMEACDIINNLFFQDRLYINRDLEQFINRIRSYHRKKNSQGIFENKEAPNQLNHEIDCLLYIVARVEHALTGVYGLLGMLPPLVTPPSGDAAITPPPELIYTRW